MARALIRQTDGLPLIVAPAKGEKNCFILDENGHLRYFLQENGTWILKTEDLFNDKIQGFEAAIDSKGNMYIFGYNQSGTLYCYFSEGDKFSLAPIYQVNGKKICHLSVCLDKEDNPQILFLSLSEQLEMWQLLYLHEKKGVWSYPEIIDFGYHTLDQKALIFRDAADRIIILQRLAEMGNYCLVFRTIQDLGGKTFYFPHKHTECFSPCFLVAPENTVHISWISSENRTLFLNYVQIAPDKTFKYFFSMELPPGSLTLAPIYLMGDKLILTCKKGEEIFYLLSFNGGRNWKWGKKINLKNHPRLTRFRSFSTSGGLEYVLTSENMQIIFPEENILALSEQQNPTLWQKEWENLELLTLSLLTHAGNLQETNTFLQEKLKQKEKELVRIYSLGAATKEKMKRELENKERELKEIEKSFKKLLAEMQENILREKEAMALENQNLTARIQKLHQKNEELKKENIAFLKKITELEDRVNSLIKENELLKAKKWLPLNFLKMIKG